jgi:hypothetical protein
LLERDDMVLWWGSLLTALDAWKRVCRAAVSPGMTHVTASLQWEHLGVASAQLTLE